VKDFSKIFRRYVPTIAKRGEPEAQTPGFVRTRAIAAARVPRMNTFIEKIFRPLLTRRKFF
jgi:hypothetical protein